MAEVSVRLVGKGVDERLGVNPKIVRAQELVLSVTGHDSRSIVIDGISRRLSSGSTGLIPMDLKRSTGYHRIQIGQSVFWFATEDSKLQLAGVSAMLRELGELGTGWTGQVMFSDGSGFRNPHVIYGWLDQWADSALDAIESVLAAPRSDTETTNVLSRRGGSSVRAVPTLRYLRSDPRHHLTARNGGLISIGDEEYDPTRVVVRKRRLTVHTVPNRRAVGLLDQLAGAVDEAMGASARDGQAVARCRLWRLRINTLQARPLARTLRDGPRVLAAERQAVELNDRRYQGVYETAKDFRRRFGWSATGDAQRRYSYVQSADRIYQAYAASRLAAELDLQQVSPVLGATPLAFSGAEFDIYYDALCPPSVLRSWRRTSIHPDTSRPDVLLVERASGRIAILDAKYRLGPDGFASEDSRKDVSAYMALYGLSTVSILYPGTDTTGRTITGNSRAILEVPVIPGSEALRMELPAILASLELPPF
ncbi:hypothetical protein [Actinoplanes sp. NPDC049802]|uniref:hypothetical protein n=1 Tax=Actinoplanes sp. NPDC049802 TaxID=3154742 RepID=UPI00340D2BBA